MSLKRLAAGVSTALAGLAFAAAAGAQELLGQPTNGGIGMQPGVSPLRHSQIFFHDAILMPLITAICLLVLGLLVWVVVKFNKKSNPTPARWSHNTPIEVLWTVVPVLILMVIAVFSFRLLFAYHDMPQPYMTVKATGYQWYWGYEYPDNGVGEQTSNMLSEADVAERRLPHSVYRFATNQPMVVPVGRVIRVQVTASDVIHAFAVPAFGVIMDAVPGRVNETWFMAERTGTFYGNCRELCGVDHAFMPIEVRVVTQAAFDAWVAEHGGHAVGAGPSAAAVPDANPTTPPATGAAPAQPLQAAPSGLPSGTAQEGGAPVAGPPVNPAPGADRPAAGAPNATGPVMAPTGAAADTPSPNQVTTSAAAPAAARR